MDGRMAKAYVTQDYGVVEGGAAQEAEGEEEGEAAQEDEAMDEGDDIIDDQQAAARTFENTNGFVFEAGEFEMMEVVLGIEDGYVGPQFVHRLTHMNVTKKLMKILRKIVQPLNLDPEAVIGLCMGARDVMQVAYRMDNDGRMVFNKEWGVFVAQNHLEVNDAVAFNFRGGNAHGINLTCVVNPLRPAEP